MKRDADGLTESPHIIVTEVPPGFLKRRNVRSHFSRFGNILRLSIQHSFCVITFENHRQARDAVTRGTYWKDMPLKIDFTLNHDPFGADEAIINEELNWFAEDPEDLERPKARPSKTKSSFKLSDMPLKKVIKVDLSNEDDASKSSEESKGYSRSWDENKSRDKRKSATYRFLEGIKSQYKSNEGKSSRYSEEMKVDSRSGEERRFSSVACDELKNKERLTESNKFTPMAFEDFTFPSNHEEVGKGASRSSGKLVSKPKQSGDNKPSSSIIDEFKFVSKVISNADREPSIYFEEQNIKSKSKYSEDIKFLSRLSGEGKSSSKILEEFKFLSKSSDDGNFVVNPPEEMKKIIKEENEAVSKFFDDNSGSSIKYLEESKGLSKPSDESKTTSKSSEERQTLVKTNEALFQSRAGSNLQDKFNILEERDRQMRQKVDKVTRIDRSMQGTCPDMCPEKERVLREMMGIIAPYESLSDGRMDHSKAVKEYARSSADQEEPLPHDLRPEPVLTMTMTYLINCIISRIDEAGDENLSNWYDFCWGRLRAIRKDIIQQQLCDKSTVTILEQCARFHIACYDRLLGTKKSQFDDKINTETLVNCLQSLIHMYEDLHKSGISCPNEAEFNAYLILLKINSGFLMSEYQSYSKNLKESKLVREAVKIHLAYNNNMYSTFFKLAKQTSYLNACLMQRFFQHVRVQALNTTIKAHCVPNKFSNISVHFIMDILKLDSSEECISFCESMGLTFNEDDRSFRVSRSDFYITDNIYFIETPSFLVLKKRVPIAEAVVGCNHTLPIYLNHTVHNSFTPEGMLKESALDASDQEEKMLRDDVERKLLISQLKATFRQKEEETSTVDSSSNVLEEKAGKESSEEEEAHMEEEVNWRDKDKGDSIQIEDNMTEPELAADKALPDPGNENSHPAPPIVSSPKVEPLSLPSPVFSSPLSSSSQSKPLNNSPSPKPNIFLERNPFPTSTVPVFSSKPMNKTKVTTTPKLPTVLKRPKPIVESPRRKNLDKPKTPPKTFFSAEKIPAVKNLSVKEYKEKLYMDKLRKKLSENMKRVSARKYLRLWKEKATRLKSFNELESMQLYNMTVKEYIRLWGKLPVRRSFNIAKRLTARKNANLMVQMILHTDIVDKIDKNVRKIGRAVINALGEKSVQLAEKWGNIAQPNPVFWKVVFALPPPPEGGSSFSTKLRNWCQAVFYTSSERQLSEAELHLSDSGTPVCCSACVIEGLSELERCANLTALVIIRARDWETTEDTENRLMKLLSLKNHPIPVAVLNIGEHVDPIKVHGMLGITHFEQCLWSNSRAVERVLCSLARNVYLYNLKVKPFCSVLEVFSEKLFDSLQQDSYLHDGLDEALIEPNNIIHFYNLLVDKVEEEITDCKINNYFGTAFELSKDIKRSYNCFLFPDNYNDTGFQRSLSHRCLKAKLRPFKTNFKDTKEVMLFFKHYCDDIGCMNILKKLVRQLNLPDEDESVNIKEHLRSVHWLPIIELLIKEILSSHLLAFKVVYREDVITNFLHSHFWFNTTIIKKMS